MEDYNPKTSNTALIAGNGALPSELYSELMRNNTNTVLIGISGEIEPELELKADSVLSYGQLGTLFDLLKTRQIGHVIFASGINKRPDFKNMKMDLVTLKEVPALLKIVMGGDNSVLEKIAAYFAKKNIVVVGAHQAVPALLAEQGLIAGKYNKNLASPIIRQAFEAAKAIGALDIGQAAIAEDGRVLTLEAVEGTDAMINRVKQLRESGRASASPKMGVLVKAMKPSQDMRADLPAIGPDTIEKVVSAGLKGIAIEAGRSLILEREKTVKMAAQCGIFIIGISKEEFAS